MDRIGTFPDEADDPQIAIASHKRGVLTLALHGHAGELALRAAADQVRDELLQSAHITQVELSGVRDYEIQVEIPQAALRRYNMTLGDAADAIAAASVELGGGSLKTEGGDILVRVKRPPQGLRRKQYARLAPTHEGGRIPRPARETWPEVREGLRGLEPCLGRFRWGTSGHDRGFPGRGPDALREVARARPKRLWKRSTRACPKG